jgi:hypothetical protein
MANVSPDVGEDLAGVGLIPAPVQLLGGDAKLDHEVARKVPRLDFPTFLSPESNQGGFIKKKTRSRLVNSNVLFGPPPILAEEDETAYDELIGRVYAAIKPVDVIDEMLIADVVASEWEFLRWSRLKLSMIQACAAKGLKGFLNSKLDYELYRERFVEDLTEILEDNLPDDDAEDRPQRLARDCAMTIRPPSTASTRYSAAST